MGLFSSKKKTYVGVSVARLVEDEDMVDVHRASVLDYVLGNDSRVDALATSYADVYRENLSKSIGVRAFNQVAWARKKYYYGPMQGYRIKEGAVNVPELMLDYLTSTLNKDDVKILYAKYGPINNQHATYQMLVTLYGYNPVTNRFARAAKSNAFLHSFKITYCKSTVDNVVNPDYLNPLGPPSTSGPTGNRPANPNAPKDTWEVSNTAEQDYVDVKFSYMEGGVEKFYTERLTFLDYEYSNKNVNNEGFVIPDNAAMDRDYYMVMYSTGGYIHMLTYSPDVGTNSKLNNLIRKDVDPGIYMPQIYITLDRKRLDRESERDTEAFKSSKLYCQSLGLNYEQLVSNLWDSIAEDESTVRDIIIAYRLPAASQDPLVHKYMYHFFYEMYKDVDAVPVRSDFEELRKEEVAVQSRKGVSITIQDKISSLILAYTSIGTRIMRGSIGPIGTANYSFVRGGSSGSSIFGGRSVSTHIYRMQLSKDTYREVHVRGLTVTQKVVGAADKLLDNQDEGLLIPIDYDLVKKIFTKERNEIMTKSLHIIITTKKVVKTKWYNSGWFKAFVFVVGVALTIATGGAALTVLGVLKAIAVSVAVNLIVTAVTKLLVSLGLDVGIAAALVAVAALAAGAYTYKSGNSLAGMNTADFMAVANHSFKVSNQGFQLEMQAKYDAYLEYMDMMEEKNAELMALRKELGLDDNVTIDMYSLLANSIRQPDIRLGETPIRFLERTTSVNSGQLPVQVVNNFALLMTQLPSFETLVERMKYV